MNKLIKLVPKPLKAYLSGNCLRVHPVNLANFSASYVDKPSVRGACRIRRRKRFNVGGALNGITHEVILVTNDTYITASQVCELLKKIADLGLIITITLVLDNARYQKCKVVEELAIYLSIELLYLPSYSPNLNLIERRWKFVKKKCLYGKYYEKFSDLSSAIYECLNDAHLKHKKELDSLLNLRFQKFNKSQIMNV